MEIIGQVRKQIKRCSENGITYAAILVEEENSGVGEHLFTIDKPNGLLAFVRNGMRVQCEYEDIKGSHVLTKIKDLSSDEGRSREYLTCTLRKIMGVDSARV